jgi:hypothetical protein
LNKKRTLSKKHSTFIAVIALLLSLASPAQAADTGYRYWGYFQAAPKATVWTAAMTGPTVNVADGAVEGWAFTFSGGAVPDASSPSVLPDFQTLCGKTRAQSGKKRVGIVVDFGPTYLAPAGERPLKTVKRCILIDKKAQGIDVLGRVVRVRADKSGLICGLAGFPRKECGVELATPAELKNK